MIVPDLSWMGWGVFLLEVFLGLSLFLAFSPAGRHPGIAHDTESALGLWVVPHERHWTYIMLMVLQWIFFVTGAGRTFGVDARLIKRLQPRAEQGSPAAVSCWRHVAVRAVGEPDLAELSPADVRRRLSPPWRCCCLAWLR